MTAGEAVIRKDERDKVSKIIRADERRRLLETVKNLFGEVAAKRVRSSLIHQEADVRPGIAIRMAAATADHFGVPVDLVSRAASAGRPTSGAHIPRYAYALALHLHGKLSFEEVGRAIGRHFSRAYVIVARARRDPALLAAAAAIAARAGSTSRAVPQSAEEAA